MQVTNRLKLPAVVGGLLGVALLMWLATRADLRAILRAQELAGIDILWLIPARAVFYLLYALGWMLLLRAFDHEGRARLGYLFWVTTVREAVDRLLPVSSVGGGFLGVRLLGWRGLDTASVGASVIMEVILTLIASCFFTAIGLFLLFSRGDAGDLDHRALTAFLLSVPAPVVIILLLRYCSIFTRLQGLFKGLLGPRASAEGGRIIDARLQDYFSHAGTLLSVGALQLLALICGSFEIWFALRLYGHPVDANAALVLESMVLAMRHVAFFVPAGIGVQEAGLVLFGQALGIGPELALSVSLAKRLRELVWGLPALASWQWLEARRVLYAGVLMVALMNPVAAVRAGTDVESEATGIARWLNPDTAPFIPVPVIDVDPNSGTTLGILPTWVQTDEHQQVRRIIAPDFLHNPYFGFGGHFRVYSYPSENEQWSFIAGVQQRVERGLDLEYESGRLREQRWSISSSLIYDRNGSSRFFGIGNDTRLREQSNYTNEQELAQVRVGLNLTRSWQIAYLARWRGVDVMHGALHHIESIEKRFGPIAGVGNNHEILHRLALIYDSRDDLTAPRKGANVTLYGGIAGRRGLFSDSMYTEAGIDAKAFWPIAPRTVLAAHAAFMYLPSTHEPLPFWALNTLGGGESDLGGSQPLRGFGTGRFYDRNAFSGSLELRRTVLSLEAVSTHVDIELTPFVDVGHVFARTGESPLSHLHTVGGIGFRGVARPFVVGYVDIGYGTEGVAAFTGINYPF